MMHRRQRQPCLWDILGAVVTTTGYIWLLLLCLALVLTGCSSTYHAQTGPWSQPMIKGKTGMPNGPKPIDQYGCYHGPTPTYPTPAPLTCITDNQRWDPYEERTSPRTWGI